MTASFYGSADIDLYTAPTPNGRKVSIFLEEAEIPYNLVLIDTKRGDQHTETFLSINPHGKIPAIKDYRPHNAEHPITIAESGAILLYLAERSGKFMPTEPHMHWEAIQWLMWQMSAFGPMLGQAHHFRFYAPDPIEYAIERYSRETRRLYKALNARLKDREFIMDALSIVDMATWPWIVPRKLQGITLDEFPNVARWNETMKARPGVRRGFDVFRDIATAEKTTGDAWQTLFNHPA